MEAQSTRLANHLADFTRDRRIVFLSMLAVFIGMFSALSAFVLLALIALITNLAFFHAFSFHLQALESHQLGAWVILMPVAGGIIIGLMARYGSEKIRGHGIPEALEAILFGRSKMSLKVALLKPLSSAISIGTGGPFGAEGPIIMTGGAMGSLFAQLFHLSSAERKTLLVAGAAGGMSAIFSTPVAAVLLAVELLLFEWRPRSFIPVAVAAAVAGAFRMYLIGLGPIFPVNPHPVLGVDVLSFALPVGLVAGLASGLLTSMVYGFEDMFERLPIHWMWWPAIGGLFVGLCGWMDPRVLGVGYDSIYSLISGRLVGNMALGLLVGKALVWSLALGSGTSGGVLAPLLMIGGALGTLEAGWLPVGDASLWGMISMAAIMGGTMRSPLTAMIFMLELTHDVNILPGLLISCVAAHMVTVLLLRRSILTEKVARHGYHITREYGIDPLSTLKVSDVMDTTLSTITTANTLKDYMEGIAGYNFPLVSHQGTIILDEQGQLAGIVTRNDLLQAMADSRDPQTPIIETGTQNVITAYADELLSDAVQRMIKNNIGRLPVVQRNNPREVIGYLGRSAVIKAQALKMNEEDKRESFWLKPA